MMFLAILLLTISYAIMSYGYVLIKGWNISWKDWINPLAPYQWPSSGNPAKIPASQVFP